VLSLCESIQARVGWKMVSSLQECLKASEKLCVSRYRVG
jgi:hypothetical protein